MSLQLLTPPSSEPVSLADAKAHLKIDGTEEDALVTSLITAARARTEWHCGRALLTQNWCLRLDRWPSDNVVEIPLPPLQSVSSIATTNPDGIRNVMDPALYRIDAASEPARVCFATGPQHLRDRDGLEIAFTAGYGEAAAVPQPIRQAILEITAELYAHRGDDAVPVGRAGQVLLAPYRIFRL
ncbi:MAG: head-tail connector protein [Rhizomicrobium sp.]|nr:head-tail connector protein [Rhizomicrobium sp.]